jgi:hypothetical protein
VVHFCDEGHVRWIELNGRVVARGRRVFPHGHWDSPAAEGEALPQSTSGGHPEKDRAKRAARDPDERFPRSLTARERAVLEAMLAVLFAGVEELRAQMSSPLAPGRCPCGCPTINFVKHEKRPGVHHVVNAAIRGTTDGLALFVADGRLQSLEYVGTSDEDPEEFPDPDCLVVEPLFPIRGSSAVEPPALGAPQEGPVGD